MENDPLSDPALNSGVKVQYALQVLKSLILRCKTKKLTDKDLNDLALIQHALEDALLELNQSHTQN